MRKRGFFKNGIHDIMRETLISDSISVSLTQEPFNNRWYETEEHGYERKNEAVLPRCNDETREKSGGVNKRSILCFSRPHDRKSIFLSCGLFAFGRNGKFTSLSQRMSKALSIVRAGGDLNPPEPNPSHSQIPDKGEIHERK